MEPEAVVGRVRVVALCIAVAFATGGPAAQPSGLKPVMREKLENTQRLLEAVVKADHAAIAKYVEPLSRISEAEIASWQVAAPGEYAKHATVFLLSVNGLQEAAAGRNADAAALEYSALVSSCTGCHRYIERSKTRTR
jgi:cytochrome c556